MRHSSRSGSVALRNHSTEIGKALREGCCKRFFTPDDKCITLCTGHQSHKLNVRKVDLSEMSAMCGMFRKMNFDSIIGLTGMYQTTMEYQSLDPSDSFAMQLFTESIQNRLRLLLAPFYQASRIRRIEACEGGSRLAPRITSSTLAVMIGQPSNRNESPQTQPPVKGIFMRIMFRKNIYSTRRFMSGLESQPRQVSPIASAIPANRGSKPPLVWLRAPLLV
jgi:hypothetical protein